MRRLALSRATELAPANTWKFSRFIFTIPIANLGPVPAQALPACIIVACPITTVVAIYLEPFINGVLHFDESLLPSFDANFKWLNEGGSPHCLCLNDLVVEIGLNLIN